MSDPNSSGNGDFVVWAKSMLAAHEKRMAAHGERMAAHDRELKGVREWRREDRARMAKQEERLEDLQTMIQLQQLAVQRIEEAGARAPAEQVRDRRAMIRELSEIDRRRPRDAAALAKALSAIHGWVRHLERGRA